MLLPPLEINHFDKHTSDNILKIGINIDGLPIFWYKKPHSIEEFLNLFIVEVLKVLKGGLNVNGILIIVNLSNKVCNAPAKGFLLLNV